MPTFTGSQKLLRHPDTKSAQLAKLFAAHAVIWEEDGDYGEHVWVECKCGWSGETQEEADAHTIDTIIRAGWTPPLETERDTSTWIARLTSGLTLAAAIVRRNGNQ